MRCNSADQALSKNPRTSITPSEDNSRKAFVGRKWCIKSNKMECGGRMTFPYVTNCIVGCKHVKVVLHPRERIVIDAYFASGGSRYHKSIKDALLPVMSPLAK